MGVLKFVGHIDRKWPVCTTDVVAENLLFLLKVCQLCQGVSNESACHEPRPAFCTNQFCITLVAFASYLSTGTLF